MLIIIISGLALIGGIVWYQFDEYSLIPVALGGTGGIILISLLILLYFNPMEINSDIQGFKAIEQTIQTDRGNENLENTALKMKIIDANRWLAKTQYYNNTVWGLWIPDTIEDLEPIK